MTFDEFSQVNRARCLAWAKGKDAGILFHSNELAGEVGEACNAVKKLYRLRMGWAGGSDTTEAIMDELADVVICADLVAMQLDGDLGAALARKFNRTSAKHGFPHRLEESPE